MSSEYPCSDWPNLITMSEMVLANGKIGEAAEIWLVSLNAGYPKPFTGDAEEEDQILIWRKEITSVSE